MPDFDDSRPFDDRLRDFDQSERGQPAPLGPQRKISISDAVGDAITRTADVLFRPFDIGKWFRLGFCAWLAVLAETVGSASNAINENTLPLFDMDSLSAWFHTYMVFLIGFGVSLLLLGVLVRWLMARGLFMFIDGIVRNRGAVVEPWREYRHVANNYFLFTLVVDVMYLFGLAACIGLGVAVAWPDIENERMESAAMTGLILGACLLLGVVIAYGLAQVILRDFVAPAQYIYQERVLDAWGRVRAEIFRGHVGTIVLFYLMKVLLSIAVGVIALFAILFTCCLGALPYLGTVILLPLHVFTRCYALCFLEQFGWPLGRTDLASEAFD